MITINVSKRKKPTVWKIKTGRTKNGGRRYVHYTHNSVGDGWANKNKISPYQRYFCYHTPLSSLFHTWSASRHVIFSTFPPYSLQRHGLRRAAVTRRDVGRGDVPTLPVRTVYDLRFTPALILLLLGIKYLLLPSLSNRLKISKVGTYTFGFFITTSSNSWQNTFTYYRINGRDYYYLYAVGSSFFRKFNFVNKYRYNCI